MIVTFRHLDGTYMMERVLNSLAAITVEVTYKEGVVGKPTEAFIVNATPDGVIICEHDETGKPILNATWLAYYDEIETITVI